MATTVLARTALLILLAVDFAGQIWPAPARGRQLQRAAVGLSVAVTAAALLVMALGAPRAAQAYQARRLVEHPCREAIAYLNAEAGGLTRTLAMDDTTLWSELNPWLHTAYDLVVVDGYNPDDRPAAVVQAEKLADLSAQGEFWWVERSEAAAATLALPWSPAAANFLATPGVYTSDVQQLGACSLSARLHAAGRTAGKFHRDRRARSTCAAWHWERRNRGRRCRWCYTGRRRRPSRAATPSSRSSLRPTGRWRRSRTTCPWPGWRRPTRGRQGSPCAMRTSLAIPPDASPGLYTLHVGLYDTAGRQPVTLARRRNRRPCNRTRGSALTRFDRPYAEHPT
jgi:hypothetical protein